jgi:hypothetical protein
VLLPWLRELLVAPEYSYRCLGWAEVDQRRCLAIELATIPKTPSGIRMINRYWVDLSRGCHPLRYEVLRGETLLLRSLDIGLTELPIPNNRRVWIPIRGRFLSYLSGPAQYAADPTFEETYAVVAHTVQLNQGLPDSTFTLDHSVTPKSARLVKLKTDFSTSRENARVKTLQKSTQPHVSPKVLQVSATQETTDRLLAEADDQAIALEASAPSRESWIRRNELALAVSSMGVLCLAIAAYWRLRAA